MSVAGVPLLEVAGDPERSMSIGLESLPMITLISNLHRSGRSCSGTFSAGGEDSLPAPKVAIIGVVWKYL